MTTHRQGAEPEVRPLWAPPCDSALDASAWFGPRHRAAVSRWRRIALLSLAALLFAVGALIVTAHAAADEPTSVGRTVERQSELREQVTARPDRAAERITRGRGTP